MRIYLKHRPLPDAKRSKDYLKKDRGQFLFFRHNCLHMQKHFRKLVDHDTLPTVFLHGNPHAENYVISHNGAGMSDFDRSRFGPYAWDIVRFLCSLSLKQEEKNGQFLPHTVLEYFLEGYVRSFQAPTVPFKGVSKTAEKAQYRVWYDSVEHYLEANGKWAKEMRKSPVDPKDATVRQLLKGYLNSRDEKHLLQDYKISEVGRGEGTFGNPRWIVALKPVKSNKVEDNLLIELKRVYQDPDNKYYFNPYPHHGLRMIEASQLYAPDLEERLGYTTHEGEEYWGRAIPHKNAKIKELLSEFELVDIAYSVATQLGRAHRQSLDQKVNPDYLITHLETHYTEFVAAADQINQEFLMAYEHFATELESKNGEESTIAA
ncbi:MAG: DUF2252 family protein [Bacteroidota bacterium]